MYPTQPPLQQYNDLSGAPLDAGYIYFGLPNQNPETSPIAVYWDVAGTQPAAQPLRTSNGYIVRSGKAANVYVGAEYSVTIKDSNGSLVFSAASSNAFDQSSGLSDDLAAPSGASLVGYLSDATGAKATTVDEKLDEWLSIVADFGATGGDSTADTAAFISACASGRTVVIRKMTSAYELVGTFPIASGTVLVFEGNPTIDLTVDEDERGFHFEDGTENAHVRGDALINLTVNTAGSDGSYNGAFTFSKFYHSTDSIGVRFCSVKGNILVDCQGPANGKPVSIYGYTEDVEIEGVRGSGTTNIALTCHWSGNGSVGALPTKTWHPHRIKWRSGRSDNSGSNLNSIVLSAVGKVVIEDCGSENVEESLFLFAGDYGYTYADNISENDACEVYVERHRVRSSNDYGLSVDMTSSGLNGSPIWVGADHNARLFIDSFDVIVPSANTATNGIVVSCLRRFDVTHFNFIEEGATNAEYAMELFGIHEANIDGKCLSRTGVLIRNCGTVNWNAHIEMYDPDPDTAHYGISASATSETTTTSGAILAGAESITLASAVTVIGAGGYLVYNDGSADHEMDILTSTFVGSTQTITISPAPVNIADGATVTLIQTVKALNIGAIELNGFASGLRLTGSATAKPRNVSAIGTIFKRCGIYDVDAVAVQGYKEVGTTHEHGGQRTTTTDRYGTNLGANAESFVINGAIYTKNNTRQRYLINVNNSAKNGLINNSLFMSFNSGATNPAAVQLNTATNVTIGADNIYGSGVTPVYP